MATLIRMPEVAANMTSAVIVSWSKAEGDRVAVGDCLAEIETEKAVIELNAEAGGVLGRILVPAGTEAAVAAPVAVLLQPGEQHVDIAALLSQEGYGEAEGVPVQEPASAIAAPSGHAPVCLPVVQATGRIFASPLARRLARESDMPLDGIAGSGPHGRIVKRDILQAKAGQASGVVSAATVSNVASAAAAAAAVASVREGTTYQRARTAVPHTAMRRTIARRLLESKTSIPHFYLRADCNVGSLLALRSQINGATPRRISVNDIVVKAVAAALRELPDMNVSWTDEALIQYASADISVAVSTDSGLITPVVRNADSKPVSVISADIAELAARAREGRLASHEYQGGSFTVSNLGMYGVQEFAAIINPPQAAILAVGTVEDRAIVDAEGEIAAASMMSVTLSVDHRAIDGALAARWLAVFKRIIENPLAALV